MYGSHLSIAGGMHKAVAAARELGLSTVQVFTKNQQQWAVKPLEEDAVKLWRDACESAGFGRTVSHASYLINLASPDETLREKSVGLFAEEVRRCDLLGIPYLVFHPGAHMGDGEAAGVARVAKSLDAVARKLPKSTTTICLESTAGAGTTLGGDLAHLGQIIGESKYPDRLGVCLDTAHLFAAGYDFRGRKYAGFIKDLDAAVGGGRVKVWHLNDSKKPLASHVDRHEHVGRGTIGDDGFRPIVRDKRWRDVPKILETPKGKDADGRPWDATNVERLEALAKRR